MAYKKGENLPINYYVIQLTVLHAAMSEVLYFFVLRWMFSTWEAISYKHFVGHLEDLGLDGRIILKFSIQEMV